MSNYRDDAALFHAGTRANKNKPLNMQARGAFNGTLNVDHEQNRGNDISDRTSDGWNHLGKTVTASNFNKSTANRTNFAIAGEYFGGVHTSVNDHYDGGFRR